MPLPTDSGTVRLFFETRTRDLLPWLRRAGARYCTHGRPRVRLSPWPDVLRPSARHPTWTETYGTRAPRSAHLGPRRSGRAARRRGNDQRRRERRSTVRRRRHPHRRRPRGRDGHGWPLSAGCDAGRPAAPLRETHRLRAPHRARHHSWRRRTPARSLASPGSAPASDDRGALRRGNPRPGEHRATGRARSHRSRPRRCATTRCWRSPTVSWRSVEEVCRRRRRRPREFTCTAERRTTRRTCWTAYRCSAPITRRGPSAPGTRTRSSRCRCSPPRLRSRRPMHWPARWPGRRGCPAASSGPTAR